MKYVEGLSKEMVIAATYSKDKNFTKLSEKAKKINDIIDSLVMSETPKRKMRSIISILLNETLPTQDSRFKCKIFTALVHLDEYGSHDYPIGEVVIVIHPTSRHAIRPDGSCGNRYTEPDGLHCRYATVEEIEAAFSDE